MDEPILYFAGLSIALFVRLDTKMWCLDRLGHCLETVWTRSGQHFCAYHYTGNTQLLLRKAFVQVRIASDPCPFLRIMSSLQQLEQLWLSAPEGKLCAREQAKAWALREVWLEDGKGQRRLSSTAGTEPPCWRRSVKGSVATRTSPHTLPVFAASICSYFQTEEALSPD